MAEKSKEVTEEKVTSKETVVAGASENDTAIEHSKSVSTHDTVPKVEMDDSKESKSILKEDEKVKEVVNSGDVIGLDPSQISVLNKPMVANKAGVPIYETAEQRWLADAAAGKLATPSAK